MKFFLPIASIFFVVTSPLFACYECGASERGSFSGSGDSGALPRDRGNLISLRYNYREIPGLAVYQGMALSGRFSFGGRVELNVDFPFSSIRVQIPVTNVSDALTAGDLMLGARLVVINEPVGSKKDAPENSLVLGGGIKVPTGGFQHGLTQDNFNGRLAHSSGSVDFRGQIDYALQWKYWGFSLSAQGWLTTPGTFGYQFGHRLSVGGGIFSFLKLHEWVRLRPGLGLSWEGILPDTWKGGIVPTTGQDSFFAGLSLDAGFKDLSVSVAYRRPFTDHGVLRLKAGEDRFNAQIGYYF